MWVCICEKCVLCLFTGEKKKKREWDEREPYFSFQKASDSAQQPACMCGWWKTCKHCLLVRSLHTFCKHMQSWLLPDAMTGVTWLGYLIHRRHLFEVSSPSHLKFRFKITQVTFLSSIQPLLHLLMSSALHDITKDSFHCLTSHRGVGNQGAGSEACRSEESTSRSLCRGCFGSLWAPEPECSWPDQSWQVGTSLQPIIS